MAEKFQSQGCVNTAEEITEKKIEDQSIFSNKMTTLVCKVCNGFHSH